MRGALSLALVTLLACTIPVSYGNSTSESLSVEQLDSIAAGGEGKSFDAEVNKLMNIIINSLYTKNEVFLRELISNGSDALDKIRFLSLTNSSALGETPDLGIFLRGDEAQNTLTITDTGIGMTKADLIANLGTIARSGTKEFVNKFQEYSDSNMIGQFGVGFYSVFLVADKVTVLTKNNDDDTQWIWQSSADGKYTIAADPRGNTLGRGTSIIIHLKEDAIEYAKESTLRQLVERYSEYITFPIHLWAKRTEQEEVELSEEEIAEEKAALRAKLEAEKEAAKAEEEDVEDLDADASAEDADEIADEDLEVATTKMVTKEVEDFETLNSVKPLWTRSADEITDEEYKDFYKASMKDYQDPLAWTHFSAEGEIEFKALLYIPSSPPSNAYDQSAKGDNMKLFVRRVFITDDFSDILPKYLSFIKGLVDSDDLPLNVSREQLQQHKTLKIIKKKLVRKAIAMIQQLKKDDPVAYDKLYELYGKALKLGVVEDSANRNRLSKLLKFHSSKTEEDTFLEDYVERMVPGQDSIYYIGGASVDALEFSPHIERLKRRGVEVLFMTDPLDEYTVQNMPKFDNKYSLVDVTKDGIKLPGDEEDAATKEADKERFAPLFKWLVEDALTGKVDKVVVSDRLATSPSAIVSSTYGYSANMERIIKAQALGDPNQMQGMMYMGGKKTMEINTRHPIVTGLLARVEEGDVSEDTQEIAEVLYETARLTSGYTVDDPTSFAGLINKVLSRSLGVEGQEVELPEDVDLSSLPREDAADAEEDDIKVEL